MLRAPRSLPFFGLLLLGCARPAESESRREPPRSVTAASAIPATSAAPETSPASAVASQRTLADAPAPASPPRPLIEPARGPRVYAKTRFVWIRPEPDSKSQWIGYLWTGESAPLKSDRPVNGPGCDSWYEVEPLGYVCVDQLRATLDASDPGYVAVARYAADLSSPWPHRYGEAETLKKALFLEGSPLKFPSLPSSVQDGRVKFRRTSTVAFTDEVQVGDENYLLTSDLAYVPKSKVTLYPRWEYRGLELGGDLALPLALFRRRDQPRFRKTAEGFEEMGTTFARLSHVRLSGEVEEAGGERYLKTLEPDGSYVRESLGVAVPKPQAFTPWGESMRAGQASRAGATPPPGRATWVEVSVDGGWLIAYEGTRPVFTTLVSPGRGGAAKPGEDPIEEARTPLGQFPISGKFATATMEAPGNLIHAAVPWAQNFSGPHAIHAAYWHDAWGEYKSGGCINLSPIDGKRLFDWTEPALPPGWHGVRWLPWRGPATLLVVHR